MPLFHRPFASLVQGTTTNDNATAGYLGEVVQSDLGSGASVAMTSNVAANITSISLTAGDWDVSLLAGWTPGATTSITRLLCEINQTGAAITFASGQYADDNFPARVPGGGGFLHTSIPAARVSLATTTTIYAVGYALFTVSTLSVWGRLTARRSR